VSEGTHGIVKSTVSVLRRPSNSRLQLPNFAKIEHYVFTDVMFDLEREQNPCQSNGCPVSLGVTMNKFLPPRV